MHVPNIIIIAHSTYPVLCTGYVVGMVRDMMAYIMIVIVPSAYNLSFWNISMKQAREQEHSSTPVEISMTSKLWLFIRYHLWHEQ